MDREDFSGEKKCFGIGFITTISPSSRARTAARVADGLSHFSIEGKLVAAPIREDEVGGGTYGAAPGGRKVEKLTVLLFQIQSLDETDEATKMGNSDGHESGGSGLGSMEDMSRVTSPLAKPAVVTEHKGEEAGAFEINLALVVTKAAAADDGDVDDDDDDGGDDVLGNGLISS